MLGDAGRASRRDAAPSRGRAATIVRSTPAGRQPAVGQPVDDRREHVRAVDAGGRRRSGREDADPGRPARPPRADASATAWSATSPSRVADQARDAVEREPAEPQRLAGTERMAVVADPGPPAAAAPSGASAAATRARSAGTVTLRLVGIAGNDMDRDSTGLQQGGLVGPRAGAARRRRRAPGGARRGGRPAGSGPWPGSRAVTVSAMRSSIDALDRLGDRQRPGSRRRGRGRRGDGLDEAPGDERPRAVVDEHRPARRPDPGRRASRAANPAATESCRRAPPATTDDDPLRAARRAAATSSRRSAAVTTTIGADARRRRQRVEGVGQQRPAGDRSRPACRDHPSGSTTPAATTIASARAAGRSPVNRAAAGRRSSGRPRSGGPA